MKLALIVVVAVLLIVIVVGVISVLDRNQLVQEREAISRQWAEVDIALQRRSDLIPNLVDMMRGYVKPDQAVFKEVSDARAAFSGARTPTERIQTNAEVDTALTRLLVMAETHPHLKSSGNFQRLQESLEASENQIAQERRKYNEAIQRYNTDIELFPANIAARIFGFRRNDAYFKTDPGARTPAHVPL